MVKNMLNQKLSGGCSDSGVYLHVSLLNEQSSAYSSKPSESQWMEEIQESEEEQEASFTTQNKDNDGHSKVWQSKNCNRSKRVYDCPVCHKRFGAPSELKRHCLIHTNQRPFQCSICCRAFRERSHLKVHIRTHDVPVKRRTPSLQSYRDNIVSCNQASKSKPSPKFLTAHNDTTSKNKQKSTVQEDQNVLTEDMLSQKICGDCSDSGVHFPDTLLIEGGWDRHTGQSSAYSSKPSESQWMEEIQESEEEREASVTTQNEDKDLNEKVLQRKNSNVNKRVYDCPVCHKKFDAPSELKRHCLIHTNQRPFQCSICCRAFRERSHLKVHIRTHTNPVKRRTPSLQSYKNNSVTSFLASKSKIKPSPKYLTVQNNASSAEKLQSASHQDDNRVTEIVACQIISGDCSESDGYLEDSLLNKEGLKLHTGLSSAYSPKPSEGQWMEEIQESEEEQEASVTTQNEDNGANSKVWQRGWDRHTGQSSAYSSKPSESQWMEEIQESEEEQEANLTTQNEDKDWMEEIQEASVTTQNEDNGVNSKVWQRGWDRHTGQSSAYSSKPSESQWMEENQESEEEREASVTTQNEDKDLNEKTLSYSHKSEAISVFHMLPCLQRTLSSKSSHQNSHQPSEEEDTITPEL
ncbi:zinc finger protein 770-like [Carassius auratus]|uniref:Zinc finger protein 770-like n=1 Tax=Carassius auratus TaxID=7957 RepID=A0A6P6IX82_CARAU|nr:zinc finger protein 770-like [Carassius auratus]